jgi:hypothetical protein
MESFITKANADRIIKKMDLSNIDISEFGKNMQFKWFNKGELRKLKAFEMFFSKPDLFLSSYIKLKPRDNENLYVFKSNSAYHEDKDCSKLHSDFKNIKIPREVILSGKEHKFIQFCKDHSELSQNYPDQFQLRLKWEFNINTEVFVHYENSGYISIENMKLPELESLIEKKILEFNNWVQKSRINQLVISNFGLQSFNYKWPEKLNLEFISIKNKEEIIEILKHFEINIKQPLIELFINYYRMKNNKDLSFDSNLLEELGFKACSYCKSILHTRLQLKYIS